MLIKLIIFSFITYILYKRPAIAIVLDQYLNSYGED